MFAFHKIAYLHFARGNKWFYIGYLFAHVSTNTAQFPSHPEPSPQRPPLPGFLPTTLQKHHVPPVQMAARSDGSKWALKVCFIYLFAGFKNVYPAASKPPGCLKITHFTLPASLPNIHSLIYCPGMHCIRKNKSGTLKGMVRFDYCGMHFRTVRS